MIETWKDTLLGEVFESITNGVNCDQKSNAGKHLITRIETISKGVINLERIGRADLNEKELSKYRLTENDILFSHINSPIHVGKTALFDKKEEVYHGVNLLRIRTVKAVDPKFLRYFLLFLYSSGFWRTVAKQSVNQASVNQKDISAVQFSYPSIEKQHEIVKKLDNALAEIDTLYGNSTSILGTVNSLLSRLIDSWIHSDSTSMKVNLGELAELKGRIGWRGLTAKEYTKQGPLFLSVHSLNHGHFVDFSRAFHISRDRYDESPEIHLAEGYILIAKDGAGLGKVGMVGMISEPTTVNSSLLVVKPKAQVQTKYLYCYFLSSDFKELIKDRLGGSTVPHLYQRDIAKIPVTLMNAEQQVEFVEKFDLSSELLEDLIRNLENRKQLILELKRAVLSAEFEAA